MWGREPHALQESRASHLALQLYSHIVFLMRPLVFQVRPLSIFSATGLVLVLSVTAIWWSWADPNRSLNSTVRMADHEAANESTEPIWPQLRGPTFDSHSAETGLADSWPEGGPPVVWTRELGQGYSGFIAVGKRLFTQTQTMYRQSLVCLDAETGDTVWTHHYGWPYDGGGLYPGPRSTPTWSAGRIYFAAPDGTLACVSAEQGTPIWSCNPKKTYRGQGTDFGFASSPVLIDDKLIVPIGGLEASVVALNPRDGTVLWTSGDSSSSYATPLPIRWRDRSLVVTPLENSIAAFDVASGHREWEVEFSEGYDEHSAAPLYQEPFLVVASPFRAGAKRYRLVEPDPLNAPSPPPVVTWETPRFSNDVASSVLVDGRIYGFDLRDAQSRVDRPSKGEFRCLDFETGRVIWSTNQVGQANLIVADQKLILFTDRGELILARPGTDEYTELARTQVFRDEICWTYPALHRGCVYLRTQTRAACVYLGQAPFESQRRVQTVLDIPRGRLLDAKWLIGGEREFPATVPEWSEFLVWYEWSLVALVIATSIAVLSRVLLAKWSSEELHRGVYWMIATLAGLLGSPLINAWQSDYVLLWPLVLWISFQLTSNLITWAERGSDPRRRRWFSRLGGLAFIGTCLLYFHLCRSLGYAIEWSFLVGFLPAFPVAVLASRFLTTRTFCWPLTDLAVSAVSFSAYFWLSVLFIKWKLVVGS